MKPNINNSKDQSAKNDNEIPEKKNSSALAAAAKGRSATDNVKSKSTSDVNGSSGLRNTGTNVSYDDKE